MAREAASNILRHADATTVRITVNETTLAIDNDGAAFGPAVTPGGGNGLTGLQRRFTEHDSTFTWHPALSACRRGPWLRPQNTPAEQLARIIERVHGGARYVDPDLAVTALGFDCPLTDRELDVLRLTRQGKSVADIAAILHLAAGTVRNYLSEAMTKLDAPSRHIAALTAHQHGWI